jgi:U4/U6 small nuclear ribonucleoprotein PRP31
LGYTRGTIGKAGHGRIRLPQIDEKTKVRISKTLQKNLQKQQIWGGSTTVKKQISGTASSVAFTPLQVGIAFKKRFRNIIFKDFFFISLQ